MKKYDVLVVGAGPAGSAAALTAARGGASVCLIDRFTFPRDKACGDLVGARGLPVLEDAGIDVTRYPLFDDTRLVGTRGEVVTLPLLAGLTYPGGARVIPRTDLDNGVRERAVDAGATFVQGRARRPLHKDDGRLEGFELDSGEVIRASTIIGADGALSRVADAAGLIDPSAVLWGYAARSYVDGDVDSPMIVLWEPRGSGYPGFGWIFPSTNGRINIGLGIGTLSRRTGAQRVQREFDEYIEWCAGHGLIPSCATDSERSIAGAWMKMGMVGTRCAATGVLLAGEAAGLTNPLTGEGIAQALESGATAGALVADDPVTAPQRYREHLGSSYLPYHSIGGSLQRLIVGRPRAAFRATRVLTQPIVAEAVGGAWSLFWNDLVREARPSPDRLMANLAQRVGHSLTARSRERKWFRDNDMAVSS